MPKHELAARIGFLIGIFAILLTGAALGTIYFSPSDLPAKHWPGHDTEWNEK